MIIKDCIKKLVDKIDLTYEEAKQAMDEMLDGGATPAQISAFLTALRMKGETTDEISGCAAGMNKKAIDIKPNCGGYIDCVGTGGDGANTFNISTTAAFVIAGAGVPIAKHGNRAVSSKCGSIDLIEALGINIMMSPEEVKSCVDEIGIGFMFARTMHPCMKTVSAVRSELGMRSVFNILGPISNPSNAPYQMIGVFNPDLTEPLANAMMKLGVKGGITMCGVDNYMDEISTIGETKVSEIKNGEVKTYTVNPESFGIKRAKPEEIIGGSAEENAKYTLDILSGQHGAKRDIVIMNAGFAIYAAEKARSIADGICMAEKSIDSGAAMKKLELLKLR